MHSLDHRRFLQHSLTAGAVSVITVHSLLALSLVAADPLAPYTGPIVRGVDWLPTLCSIVGIQINQAEFDGEDASAAWLGKAAHVRARPLFWKTSSPGSEAYIREGRWKLRYPTRKNGGEKELYDLAADPSESKNIAALHPEIAVQLSAKVAAWAGTLPKEYLKTKDKED